MDRIRLGLIGDNIATSRAPQLHRLAGQLCGLEVTYELLVPRERGQDFAELFDACARQGYRGLNITYPYKEDAVLRASIGQPLVRTMGAINTVIFEPDGPQGYNTDYSGFVRAHRRVLGTVPGVTCLVGAGGVGKAVAFGLLELGVDELRIVERDLAKAESLAAALATVRPGLRVTATNDVYLAAAGADGFANCTPLGMVGHEGTAVPDELLRDKAGAWAFDAVYTPSDTRFLRAAGAAGLRVMSGYELFISQGVDAFERFCGRRVDEETLRRLLFTT